MKIIIENYIFIGFFTVIIGYIIEHLLSSNNINDNYLTKLNKQNKIKFIIYMFSIGVIIQFILQIIGFETYCERKCELNKCFYNCNIKFNDLF